MTPLTFFLIIKANVVIFMDTQTRDMLVDFGDLKHDLKTETDFFDHALIIEKGSLKPTTLTALQEENFKIVELPFRPTAERMASYFYTKMKFHGYTLRRVTNSSDL